MVEGADALRDPGRRRLNQIVVYTHRPHLLTMRERREEYSRPLHWWDMAEALPARASLYNIVAIGAMNPRLHHPAWYQLIGAISSGEADEAASSPVVCVQPFATFRFDDITIACQENRWEISTGKLSARPRLLSIAALVFAKLNETPIEIFGFNSNFDVETRVRNVRECLTRLLIGLDVGLPDQQDATHFCGINMRHAYDDHSIHIRVQPSQLSDDVLFIGYNTEYLTKSAGPGYFDFGKLIAPRFDEHLQMATENAQRILAQLGKRC